MVHLSPCTVVVASSTSPSKALTVAPCGPMPVASSEPKLSVEMLYYTGLAVNDALPMGLAYCCVPSSQL